MEISNVTNIANHRSVSQTSSGGDRRASDKTQEVRLKGQARAELRNNVEQRQIEQNQARQRQLEARLLAIARDNAQETELNNQRRQQNLVNFNRQRIREAYLANESEAIKQQQVSQHHERELTSQDHHNVIELVV